MNMAHEVPLRNLLIMRHAKSSWADETLTDYERPLNKRGQRDAPRMAAVLRDAGLIPDWVIASSANRAQATGRLVVDYLDSPGLDCQTTRDLYHAPPESYLEYLSLLGDNHQTILMIGHNPGIEQLVYHLSDRYEAMPTAAIAWFQFETDNWAALETRQPDNLRVVWRPKEID